MHWIVEPMSMIGHRAPPRQVLPVSPCRPTTLARCRTGQSRH